MDMRWFSRLIGVLFLVLGVAGFFMENFLGLLHFDLTHNLIHLLVGISGIFASTSTELHVKLFTRGLGIGYVLLALIGFVTPDMLGMMMLHETDHIIHLLVGGLALYMGFISESQNVVKVKKTS